MSRRYLRPGVLVGHLLVLAAALTCLRLGWWQWGVAHATRGTAQNLGYALLWPVFAGAFIYMWLRFLHLESVRDAELAELTGGASGGGDGAAGAERSTGDDDTRAAAVGEAGPSSREADPAYLVSAFEGSCGEDIRAEAAAEPAASDSSSESGPMPPTDEPAPDQPASRARRTRRPPAESYTIAVATVGGDDEDDPELAAYNRALAALAEQDRRRAR